MSDLIGLAKYAISMCRDINPKLNYAYKDIFNRRKIKESTMFILSEGFNSEEEIDLYYSFKVTQVYFKIKEMNDSDKIIAFQNEDTCKVAFKDVILDDSEFEEFKTKRKD